MLASINVITVYSRLAKESFFFDLENFKNRSGSNIFNRVQLCHTGEKGRQKNTTKEKTNNIH